jgi:hypothetical protein
VEIHGAGSQKDRNRREAIRDRNLRPALQGEREKAGGNLLPG